MYYLGSRSLLKKQSSSSSAISNINVPMPAVVVPPPASSTITVNTNKSQNNVTTSTSTNYFATPNIQCAATNVSGTSTDSSYSPHGMRMHQEQLQKSPKKSTSLPTPAAPQMLHSPPCSKVKINKIILIYLRRRKIVYIIYIKFLIPIN